jgi:hypothetical protein
MSTTHVSTSLGLQAALICACQVGVNGITVDCGTRLCSMQLSWPLADDERQDAVLGIASMIASYEAPAWGDRRTSCRLTR